MFDGGPHPGAGTLGDKVFKGVVIGIFGLCGAAWVAMVVHYIVTYA